MQVMILAGGLSPERDVSIRSGRRVAEALRGLFDVQVIDVDAGLLSRLRDDRPDCVIPLLHGAAGEDGSLRDVLDSLGIPYVGSDAAACRRSFDKAVAKSLLHGVHVADSVALPHNVFRELGAAEVMAALVTRFGLPLIVKPTKSGSALGTSIVKDTLEFPSAMVGAFAYGDQVMVEQFIEGREIAVSVVEHKGEARALPAIEIVPDSELYDYNARYTAGSTEFFAPARLSEDEARAAAELALSAHRQLGLRHYSRTDMIMTPSGPVFLEVNVAPGTTETSLLPQALDCAGLTLQSVFGELVDLAIGKN